MILSRCLYLVPTIGFEMTMYDAVENNNVTTEVCAVVRGSVALDRTVVVMIQTRDGSAMGKFKGAKYTKGCFIR